MITYSRSHKEFTIKKGNIIIIVKQEEFNEMLKLYLESYGVIFD